MPLFDVHSFRQFRSKVTDVEAESPLEAIAKIENDEAFDTEVRRLIAYEGGTGPVSEMEYQDGGSPVGWLVDPKDENHPQHGDGISYDADGSGDPVLVNDPDSKPSPIQNLVVGAFELDMPEQGHKDARGVQEQIRFRDPLAAAIFGALGECTDVERADEILSELEHRTASLRRALTGLATPSDPRIPIGVDHVLRAHGLHGVFVESEDEQCDDDVEIRREGSDDDLGSIQICGPDQYMAATWTSAAKVARRHGHVHRTGAEAAKEAIEMLTKDSII